MPCTLWLNLHDSADVHKLHPQHKTPINALFLIGALTMLAPFAGRGMMVWICDAGNFGCCLAYCMVSLSFLILRKKEPDMPRPYRVPAYKFVGTMAVLMSGCMVLVYCIPGSGGTLVWQEWLMVGGWSLLGVVFFAVCKFKYKREVRQSDRADLRRGRSVPDAGGRRCGTRRCYRCSDRPCPCQNGWLKLR